MLSPIIDNLARQFTGRVIIAKLDTTRSLNTPSQFQIRGVPTLIFFKNGEKVEQLTGAIPEEILTQKLNQLVQ
jgi:thioredoxin-like negative regulator of GroEL